MCFKTGRALDQDFFIKLSRQGIEVERVTLLTDCAQGTRNLFSCLEILTGVQGTAEVAQDPYP